MLKYQNLPPSRHTHSGKALTHVRQAASSLLSGEHQAGA